MKNTLEVSHGLEYIQKLEEFVSSLQGLDEEERNRLLIVCSETFENLIHHSKSPGSVIRMRVYKNRTLSVIFQFVSSNFNLYVSNMKNVNVYYDHKCNRYRGMGVVMCMNLSISMHLRITQKYNAISIRVV